MPSRPIHYKASTYDRKSSSIQGLCDHTRLIALNPAPSGVLELRATRRFLEATPMKEVTFQHARESARGALYESLSGR